MPVDQPITLYVLSGFHIGRARKRFKEFNQKSGADNVDVIFSESVVRNRPAWSVVILNFLLLPILVLTLWLYLGIMRIFSFTPFTDGKLQQLIEEEYDADIAYVDENFHQLLGQFRYLFATGHWLFVVIGALAAISWIRLEYFGISYIPLQIVTLMLTLGIGMTAYFLSATLYTRNDTMIESMERYVRENEVASGVMIVGARHFDEEFKDEINDSNLIELSEWNQT